jgi:hypothetical protein
MVAVQAAAAAAVAVRAELVEQVVLVEVRPMVFIYLQMEPGLISFKVLLMQVQLAQVV